MLLLSRFGAELSPVSTRVFPVGSAGLCLLPHSSALLPAEKVIDALRGRQRLSDGTKKSRLRSALTFFWSHHALGIELVEMGIKK